jgi:hypothetical protein
VGARKSRGRRAAALQRRHDARFARQRHDGYVTVSNSRPDINLQLDGSSSYRSLGIMLTKLESDGAASPRFAVEPAQAPARVNEATTEIEEIATEHMEICMEVKFPEQISLEAGVTSSQLAPHVRDGIRSDAASAVERLRAAGAYREGHAAEAGSLAAL